MKYFLTLLLLNMSLFLSGCNPFASYSHKPLTTQEAQDLNNFLNQNYPVNSDERKLISDYTARGYKYVVESSIPPSAILRKHLESQDHCSWMEGAEGNIVIEWQSDSQGKIKNIKSYKSFCLLTP